MEESIIADNQIETIAYNIYKDIKPYIQDNTNDFVFWLLDFRVVSLDGIIEIDGLYEYNICQNQRRRILWVKI